MADAVYAATALSQQQPCCCCSIAQSSCCSHPAGPLAAVLLLPCCCRTCPAPRCTPAMLPPPGRHWRPCWAQSSCSGTAARPRWTHPPRRARCAAHLWCRWCACRACSMDTRRITCHTIVQAVKPSCLAGSDACSTVLLAYMCFLLACFAQLAVLPRTCWRPHTRCSSSGRAGWCRRQGSQACTQMWLRGHNRQNNAVSA